MRKILLPIAAIFIAALSNFCGAKEADSIQLLDKNTWLPITGASYFSKSHSGISDENGKIIFNYQRNDTLFISHISYGSWFLNGNELQSAASDGVIYRQKEILTSQPITIMAFRRRAQVQEKFNLDVRDKLAHDAGFVLAQTPLISGIRKSGSYGFDPVMRGFKYDRLNIVINGAQCAAAACPNRMDPPISQIAPNMMDHVEILKGPHSFRYGTSFGGTINFESVPARFSAKKNFYGRFSAGTESNGGIYRTEGAAGYIGRTFNLGLFGSFSSGNDYDDGRGRSVGADFQRSSFGTELGLNISKNQNAVFTAVRNTAEDTDFPALPMDLRSDKTSMFSARHNINVNADYLKYWNTSGYVTLVDHKMDNLGKLLDPRKVNAFTNAETKTYGGRTEAAWTFEKGRLYSGLDLKIESAKGTRNREFLMGPNAGRTAYDNVWNGGQVNKYGMFAEYHQLFTLFKLVLSGRLEYNQAEADDIDPEFLQKNPKKAVAQINPNFSIGAYKDFSDAVSAGIWLGRAQRSGSLTERYINSFPVGLDAYEMLGSPKLDPETNNQADIILGYKTNSTQINLSIFASLLNNYISSKIDTSLSPVLPSSPGVRRFANIEDAFKTGFELTWKQKLTAGIEHRLNIAYTFARDNTLDEPLPETAPLDLRYALSGGFLNNKLQPFFAYRYVLKQDRISKTFGETQTPSFSTLDFNIAYQLNNYIEASAGIQNLFDESYYEHLNRPVKGQPRAVYSPGRSFHFTIFIDFM